MLSAPTRRPTPGTLTTSSTAITGFKPKRATTSSPAGTPVANALVPDLINTFLINLKTVPIVATPQIAYTLPVATISFAVPSRHIGVQNITVHWGDGTVSTSTTGALWIKATSAGSFSVAGSHAYSALGFYRVTVTASDGHGYQVSLTMRAEVVTAALIWGQPHPIVTNSGLSFFGAVATFTDDNPFEPFSNYTAVISWATALIAPPRSSKRPVLRARTGRDRPLAVIDATARIEQNSAGGFTVLARRPIRTRAPIGSW